MALLNPPNVLTKIREDLRQKQALDEKFVQNLLYYFELRVPPEVAQGARVPYIYPLILSPNAYRISEPFTVGRQFTRGGGIFVEESGIIAREITVSGTTGFKPRPWGKKQSEFSSIAFPGDGKSFSRTTAQFQAAVEALSGQRHFQFLQDSVFRTYADLKRNPATARGTELYFHVQKDDESWRVIPLSFELSRDQSNPLSYPYSFSLLAVGPADESVKGQSEDAEVVDKINDAFAMVKAGTAQIRAAIQDVTGVQEQVRVTALGGANLIADAGSIADAADDFISGSKRLIDVPLSYIAQTQRALDSALNVLNDTVTLSGGPDVPGSVLNSLRRMIEGLEMLGSYPEKFVDSVTVAVDRFQRLQELSTSQSQERLDSAALSTPTTFRAVEERGSGLRPGDAVRSSEELGLGRAVPVFSSARTHVLDDFDTLENLASRFLGDARLWKHIAIFNGLSSPFISDQGLPGTLAPGQTILIPSTEAPVERADIPTTQGVDPVVASGRDQVLGTDFKMEPVSGAQGSNRTTYDLAIDVEGGSLDFKTLSGVENLQQGILARLLTEKGNDILYRNLGTSRVVGLGLTAADLDVARIRIVEAVQADPRITGVRRVSFDVEDTSPDTLIVELDAEVRGLNTPLVVRAATEV